MVPLPPTQVVVPNILCNPLPPLNNNTTKEAIHNNTPHLHTKATALHRRRVRCTINNNHIRGRHIAPELGRVAALHSWPH